MSAERPFLVVKHPDTESAMRHDIPHPKAVFMSGAIFNLLRGELPSN